MESAAKNVTIVASDMLGELHKLWEHRRPLGTPAAVDLHSLKETRKLHALSLVCYAQRASEDVDVYPLINPEGTNRLNRTAACEHAALICEEFMQRQMRILTAATIVLNTALLTRAVWAADPASVYREDIKPVLRERCYACHGALKQEGNLRLDTVELARKGGDSGPAVVPGSASQSLLFQRVSSSEEYERMPPEGKPLTADQQAVLKRWIEAGAVAPADETPETTPDEHWAFRTPVAATPPKSASSGPAANPIDAFLSARRDRQGLKPLPPAEPAIQLRRVYLDLIGLPPTFAQLQEFLSDTRPDAYARAVDRLLASPHYGERWGRHWMDVWRYTDWYGLGAQLRYSQKHIWHWRDWIVEALNQDKGYDQMVREMLAADELYPTDADRLRATGFLARNYYLFNRTTWLDNTIEHTSRAFLGMTMQCAKCHDHKYDPITQRDYYRLRAIFEPHQIRLDPVPGVIDLEVDGLPRAFDAHPDTPTYVHIRGNDKDPDTSEAMTPAIPAFFADAMPQVEPVELPPNAFHPALQAFVLDDQLAAAQKAIESAQASLQSARDDLTAFASRSSQRNAVLALFESIDTQEVFTHDEFDELDMEGWTVGDGQWHIQDGKLRQDAVGAQRCYIRSVREHPQDFALRARFQTLGGQKWKSVGFCFDVAGGDEKMVYLSAVQPGSKLQISFKHNGQQQYPPAAKQDRSVALGQTYELIAAVRGRLINVYLDGQHVLSYEFPLARKSGRIDLIAFDAIVEFDEVSILRLPADTPLAQDAARKLPTSLEEARLAVELAKHRLSVARLKPAVLRSAHAADRAKASVDPATSGTDGKGAGSSDDQRILEATRHAQQLRLAKLQVKAAEARQKLFAAAPDKQAEAEKELEQASAAIVSFRQQVAQDPLAGGYESLRASSKAAEGPDEDEASRTKPYPRTSTGRRTALARWITEPRNPLTARVMVNHIWLRHFGQPLVETVDDFGRRAPQPIHQDVLDYLAVEFMQNGWSMKHLHRLIVNSDAYRLSGRTALADSQTLTRDPDNLHYWKRSSVRMESEVIRDSLLHLAGALNTRMEGPTIDPAQEDVSRRRSLYFTLSRDARHEFLTMFDPADILGCYRRHESIVPQQALAMSNSKLALQLAREISDRIAGDSARVTEMSDEEFAVRALLTLLCRTPLSEEVRACTETLRELRETVAVSDPADVTRRSRADLIHALLNHNDFITIR